MAYSVGDTVTLDGIESLIVYDAGSEQSWGRYLCVDKNHDIIYYFAGKDYTLSDNSSSIAPTYKYGYEWGKYTINIIPTNVTDQNIGAGLSNTNTLISLGLLAYSPDSYYCLWDKVEEFREQINSNEWFVPSYLELLEVYNHKNLLSNLVSSNDLNSYYWASTESTESRAYRVNFISGGGGDTSKSGGDRRTRLCRYLSDPEELDVVDIYLILIRTFKSPVLPLNLKFTIQMIILILPHPLIYIPLYFKQKMVI